jgi:hypothetical protein
MRAQKYVILVSILAATSLRVAAQDMLSCSKINDDSERLACYDSVAGRVEEALTKDVQGTAVSRIKEREESIQAAVIGDYDVAAQEYEGFVIAKIYLNNQRRPVYVSKDGRVFQQVSGITPFAQVGDQVELEQGMFGSVFLKTSSGGRVKVKEK